MFDFISTRALVFVYLLPVAIGSSTALAAIQSYQPNNKQQLSGLVKQFVSNNPVIKKAQAVVQATEARLSGSTLPLNNPELAFESSRSDVSTFTVGVSQTIDWYDKKNGLEQIARAELNAAQWQLENIIVVQSAEFLRSYGNIAAYNEIASLSLLRVEILSRFRQLANQRFQAGDISQSEVELARLSLTEAVMQHATNGAGLIQAKTDFFMLNGAPLAKTPRFPKTLPSSLSVQSDLTLLAKEHPEVKSYLQKSLMAKQQIKVISRQRKADPTFGLTAGKEGSDTLIGLSLSIPLNVRNKFQSNVDETRAQALQAEQNAHQAYRSLLGEIQGAQEQYNLVMAAWLIWSDQGKSSLQQRSKLLDIQWQAGEMSTTDYLIQLQQTIDTQIAGAELHNSLWQSWINWLSSTNTLTNWLTTNSKGTK